MEDTGCPPPPLWFPFTREELELGLGVYGAVATALTFAGVSRLSLGWGSLCALILAYLAGLLVHARRHRAAFSILPGGALQGRGYVPLMRRAKHSILLTHVDDDPPGNELLGLYKRLVSEGVELRRVLFIRDDGHPNALNWVEDFGEHARLEQRAILPGQAEAMRMSFVVIDEEIVVLSVPGGRVTDGEAYSRGLFFRDLLVIRDSRVAEAFTESHAQLWMRAHRLDAIRGVLV